MAVWKCMGRERLDEDTNEPVCNYEAERPWRGRCPRCGGVYDCRKFGVDRTKRVEITAASSTDTRLAIQYIPTGVVGFDNVIGGIQGKGVVKGQSILLGGPAGSRKTSLSLIVMDGLTKQTDRPMLYASAEQNSDGVLQFCRLLNVTSPQIKIRGNAVHLEDLLQYCDEIRPFAAVFDSMQAMGKGSGVSEDIISDRIAEYSRRTKMISIIISHLTLALSFKGGTGPVHNVDTVMMYEPYVAKLDGNPVKMFGRKVADEIGWNPELDDDVLPAVRVLVGGAGGKNRWGDINQKSYWWTPPGGAMVHLHRQEVDPGIDDLKRRLRRVRD